MSELNNLLRKIKAYRPDFQEKKVRKAFAFAEKVHAGHRRNTGESYFDHLYNTALYLVDLQADEETICAALLHDTVEDAGVSFGEIEKEFGEAVSKLVRGVTKVSKVRYRQRMAERQVISLRRMFVGMAEDLRVIIIKLADRLHNMQTLHGVRPDKQLRIAKETLEIYCPLANLLGIWHLRWQLEDLCFKHLYPTEYQRIDNFFGGRQKESKKYTEKLRQVIQEKLEKNNLSCSVEGRTKHYYSIFQKIQRQPRKLEGVYDVFALRIVVDNIEDCYKALGMTHSLWKPKTSRFKDYIAVPKPNGYQSLHTTVFGPGGKAVEIQIRTQKMHEEAEYGVAAHWFYKNELSPDYQKKSDWIIQLLNLQKVQKDNRDFVEDLKVDIFQDRIFVFTPQGEVKDLPQGASVLDFAYAVHSEVGNHFQKALVNGMELSASSLLNTGDTVEVKTDPNVSPELSWIKYVKTNKAKEDIRSFFRKESKANKVLLGRNLLGKVLEREGKDNLEKFIKHRNFSSALNRFKFKDVQALFKAICEEKIKPGEFIKEVYSKKKKLFPNLFLPKREERIQDETAELVNMEISGRDRRGILGDIASTISKENVNIASFKVHAIYGTNKFYYLVRLEIPSPQVLENIFERLEEIEDVERVKKITHSYSAFSKTIISLTLLVAHFFLLYLLAGNVYLFYISFILPAFAFWLLHKVIYTETSFYSRKREIIMLASMVTAVGILFNSWELYSFDIPYSHPILLYVIILNIPFLVSRIGRYFSDSIRKKGRIGFLLSSWIKEKKFIRAKVIHLDSKSKLYRNISNAYENYLFSDYQKNYLRYNCWQSHFDKIHDQIDLLTKDQDDLSNKT
ncbi:MAG TPA: bifunctional (p)ppGpp synthetase/guanosine-3',5'-bis(diphosphate) 3'-pyrophosphohydrolase, partial [Candidatus Aminicenantes bacterium]|nr:bifunctional (p)ppGpp synthetase/guanosine-3',5'-bis(diphosphate) 3'-pyrophosphohydrolase [Candidatus Aminicenantes bacterium]